MKLIFPYENRLSKFGNIPTVSFWLNVISPDGPIPLFFLFDTGADISSISTLAAKKLGIDLEKCEKETMTGFEGKSVIVYRSKITIALNKKKYVIPCVFHDNEDVPFLLGRAEILNKFTITLDAKKKTAEFKEI